MGYDGDISLVAGADDPIDVLGDAMETLKSVLSGLAYAGFVILGLVQWSAVVDGLQNYLHLKWIVASVCSSPVFLPRATRAHLWRRHCLGVDLKPNCTTFLVGFVCIGYRGCRPQEHAHLIFHLWTELTGESRVPSFSFAPG